MAFCRRPDGMELSARQSPQPCAQKQQYQITADDGLLSTATQRTQLSRDAFYDSALYKCEIHVEIDITKRN